MGAVVAAGAIIGGWFIGKSVSDSSKNVARGAENSAKTVAEGMRYTGDRAQQAADLLRLGLCDVGGSVENASRNIRCGIRDHATGLIVSSQNVQTGLESIGGNFAKGTKNLRDGAISIGQSFVLGTANLQDGANSIANSINYGSVNLQLGASDIANSIGQHGMAMTVSTQHLQAAIETMAARFENGMESFGLNTIDRILKSINQMMSKVKYTTIYVVLPAVLIFIAIFLMAKKAISWSSFATIYEIVRINSSLLMASSTFGVILYLCYVLQTVHLRLTWLQAQFVNNMMLHQNYVNNIQCNLFRIQNAVLIMKNFCPMNVAHSSSGATVLAGKAGIYFGAQWKSSDDWYYVSKDVSPRIIIRLVRKFQLSCIQIKASNCQYKLSVSDNGTEYLDLELKKHSTDLTTYYEIFSVPEQFLVQYIKIFPSNPDIPFYLNDLFAVPKSAIPLEENAINSDASDSDSEIEPEDKNKNKNVP